MSDYPLKHRTHLWELLESQQEGNAAHQWDLVIVGGGITGAGILREATVHGLRAILLEQQDFSWGTSSRSSKMVHGGIRYLSMGDLTLTRHSLSEREHLLEQAPGLVRRMGYYFTLSKGAKLPSVAVKILLWVYDLLAGISDHKSISLLKLGQHFKGIDLTSLKSAFYYTDAVTDDSRLVQRVIQEAVVDGAAAMNYVKVSDLLKSSAGVVRGVELTDILSGNKVNVRAAVVINATGAWADRLRNQLNPEKRIRPQRGSHLVVSGQRLPVSAALTLSHPDDGRTLFIYPWEGRTVVGTTDLDHPADLDLEASITSEEVNYLLRAANHCFPQVDLKTGDIISTWAGVRPIIGSEKSKDPSKERRDHAVWTDSNLVTVSGGKLTTFRLIARDALQAAVQMLPGRKLISFDSNARIFKNTTLNPSELLPSDPSFASELIGRYGDLAAEVISGSSAAETTPLADTGFCLAECRWALREESVQHLDDLMLRRTRLGLILAGGGEQLFQQLQRLFSEELGWDSERWQIEVNRYQALWQNYYFLPQ